MSETFQIISDGSCDLPQDVVAEKKIKVVPFYVSFDGENYAKEIEEVGIRDFYQRMVDNPKLYPKSSLPSTQDYIDAFMPYVEAKTPVICICITLKFSGSFQSAMNAKNIILEDYPDAKIAVIDSTLDTVCQGVYTLEAVKLRDAGLSFEETVEKLEALKETGRIFFTVGGVEYLAQGGRIGKVAVAAVSVLGIRPIITLKNGEIYPSGIGRSRKGTVGKCTELLINHLKTLDDYKNYSYCIGFGYDEQEAESFRKETVEKLNAAGFPLTEEDFPLYQIGATIAVHTGPHPLGYGVIRKGLV